MIGVGLIGYGYWGPNLARNFSAQPDCSLVSICDSNPARTELARRHYPSARVTGDVEELFSNPAIKAILIAVPVSAQWPSL